MNSEKGKYYTKSVSGELMKELRERAGHKSQKACAKAMGISTAQYGRHERGENVKRNTLIEMLVFFDTNIGEYYTEVVRRVKIKLEVDLLNKNNKTDK